MKIIGISGKIGAGKNTLADFLVRYAETTHPEYHPTAVGFADLVKEYVAASFGADRGKLFGTQEDKNTPLEINPAITYRGACVAVGMFYRSIDERFWVRKTFESLAELQRYTRAEVLACITDVRFPCECGDILARGGIVLRLTATRGATAAQLANESETALDGYPRFTAIIDNRDLTTLETAACSVRVCTERGIFRKC